MCAVNKARAHVGPHRRPAMVSCRRSGSLLEDPRDDGIRMAMLTDVRQPRAPGCWGR